MLAYKDLRVRYAQTIVGFAWAIFNPLIQIIVLSFVFGTIAKVGTGTSEIPHILYTTAGMCGWAYFANLFSNASQSIIGAQGMIKKIYFPRIILPISKAITASVDLVVMIFLVFLLMLYYRIPVSSSLIFFPFFLILAIISGLTIGIWISAITIRYRDFIHIIPLLLRIGMYVTPIAYPVSSVPQKYRVLFYCNPMTGVVEGMRWSLIGDTPPHSYMYISIVIMIFLFFGGIIYFLKIERQIADII